MSDKVKVQSVHAPGAILFEVAKGPDWRQVFPHDGEDAANVRWALADLSFYPTTDIGEDPGYAVAEVNYRTALHQMVEELDRTDLRAVFQLARVLAVVPRDPAIFTYIAKRSARFLRLLAAVLTV